MSRAAVEKFRMAFVTGDASTHALIADRMRQDPDGAARWLKLAKRGRPKRDKHCDDLLRQLRACPVFAPLSANAAAIEIAKFLARYGATGWRFERDAASNPHAEGPHRADPRAVAWALAHALGPHFPPSARTVRRALSKLGQK
jgi:hypothetical protein